MKSEDYMMIGSTKVNISKEITTASQEVFDKYLKSLNLSKFGEQILLEIRKQDIKSL